MRFNLQASHCFRHNSTPGPVAHQGDQCASDGAAKWPGQRSHRRRANGGDHRGDGGRPAPAGSRLTQRNSDPRAQVHTCPSAAVVHELGEYSAGGLWLPVRVGQRQAKH